MGRWDRGGRRLHGDSEKIHPGNWLGRHVGVGYSDRESRHPLGLRQSRRRRERMNLESGLEPEQKGHEDGSGCTQMRNAEVQQRQSQGH